MTSYQVLFTSNALGDLERLDRIIQARVLNRLQWLADNVSVITHQPMQGSEWSGCFRLRTGDFRIIYELNHAELSLNVLKIGHRRDVYRG